MAKRLPSMVDVAKRAGVSHQTVSRVLNEHKSVTSKTREKVFMAITELGYRPNHAAKALVTGKTSTIGVLSYDTTLFGPASMLHAVQSAAREVGYAVNIVSLKSTDRTSVIAGIQELVDVGVDGMVIIAPQSEDETLLAHLSGNLPAVIVEGEDASTIPSVNVDQFSGAVIAMEHLISLGHKKIAHISGPLNWFESQQRRKGWSTTLIKAGLEPDIFAVGDWSPRSGYEATKELMARARPTAIFAANDAMALGTLKALSELNITVPSEMSLIGFDNVPEAEFFVPGLTTVIQDFEEVGKLCVNLLVKLIAHEEFGESRLVIQPELCLRGSTSRPSKQ